MKTDWKSSQTDRQGTLAVVSPASTGNKSQSRHTNAATSTAVNNPGEWKTTRPLNYGPDQKKAGGVLGVWWWGVGGGGVELRTLPDK